MRGWPSNIEVINTRGDRLEYAQVGTASTTQAVGRKERGNSLAANAPAAFLSWNTETFRPTR